MRRLKKIYIITSLAGFALGVYLSKKKECNKSNADMMTVIEENFDEANMDSLKEKLQDLLTKLNTKKIKKTTVSLLKTSLLQLQSMLVHVSRQDKLLVLLFRREYVRNYGISKRQHLL